MRMFEQIVSALSVTPVCPRCKSVIPSEDINVANDIAFCRNCNLSHSLSALTSGRIVDENVDLSRPPAGTWFQRDADGTLIGATNRSAGQAFGLLFFSMFWNGIVSLFVLMAAASTLQHLGVSLPSWLHGHFSKSGNIPIRLTIFLWLFLTPFIAIGLVVFLSFLSSLAGRTEIRLQGGQGFLFTGVGPLGFRKRFDTSNVRDVRIQDRRWRDNDGASGRTTRIIIDTDGRQLNFGSMLTRERRAFVAGALKKELVHS